MIPSRQAIDDYLTLRRALGFKLAKQERLLGDFLDDLQRSGASTITTDAAVTWATKPAAAQPIRWRARLCVIRGFASYLRAVDPTVEVPAVDLLPHRHHRPAPYLFSPTDITALLAATNQIRSPLLAATYHAMFGLLAATGMRVGEVICLDDADVDLTAGLLTIRETKFGKSRQLPVHPTTVAALHSHVHQRDRLCPRPTTTKTSFFTSTVGTRLVYPNVASTFRRLLKSAEIGPGPRIHDYADLFVMPTSARKPWLAGAIPALMSA